VGVLVLLGATAGYQLGMQVILTVTHSITSNTFVSAYKDDLSSDSGRGTATVLFTMLGMLVSYLISTAAFSRLVVIGDQLSSMAGE